MNILEEICTHKRKELIPLKEELSLDALKEQALEVAVKDDFISALKSVPMGIIAEVKRRSPSAGLIRDPFDPAEIATSYAEAGVQGISCLMDSRYFGGGVEDFSAVAAAVDTPLLYKEFVVDEWQVWHARKMQATLVLLIVAAMEQAELATLYNHCVEAGMQVLMEVHNEAEMDVAIELGASLIGVNNRNLKTFETSLETSIRLRDRAPDNCSFISESGIRDAEDIALLHRHGVDGVLVGEHLLRKPDIGLAVQELMGGVWASS